MDLLTACAFVAIPVLVAANAWIVTKLRVEVRHDDGRSDT